MLQESNRIDMLVPRSISGTADQLSTYPGYEWIAKLPDKKIYFALFQGWGMGNLPPGYDYYIVSFHLEAVNLDWLKCQQTTGPIIVLFDGYDYGYNIPNVHFVTFFYWHYQLQTMHEWFGVETKPNPTYKFSAVCNRISQSKVWITTKLLETARDSSLIILNSWLEEKNVHNWEYTGNARLDNLTQTFRDKYAGQQIQIDDFDNDTQNKQRITGNPWQPLYQDCAVHFTNESFHYSNMGNYTWPGPFLTEKTLKCLLGGTAFVPVGQFETYKILTNLGLEFDYGFDTEWDSDPGNLSRAQSIVDLIDQLNQYTPAELVDQTKHASEHNQNYILSGQFFDRCNRANEQAINQIFKLIS